MSLEPVLKSSLAGLGDCSHVLVGSDFDGTLAAIVNRPEQATPHPRAMEALSRLADLERASVAIVSGRAHSDLAALSSSTPGVVLIGEHGNDRGEGGIAPEVAEMAEMAQEAGRSLPGSLVEVKRHSITFHYRNTDRDAARDTVEKLKAWAAGRPEITVTEGKDIVELSVAPHHKGDAVLALKEESGAERVVFLGDDTTDESVFEVLGPDDIGIKVGPGETTARYRVDDIEGVVRVLETIAQVMA